MILAVAIFISLFFFFFALFLIHEVMYKHDCVISNTFFMMNLLTFAGKNTQTSTVYVYVHS